MSGRTRDFLNLSDQCVAQYGALAFDGQGVAIRQGAHLNPEVRERYFVLRKFSGREQQRVDAPLLREVFLQPTERNKHRVDVALRRLQREIADLLPDREPDGAARVLL